MRAATLQLRTTFALCALVTVASIAAAGPNTGGTLILHANPAAIYTVDDNIYCDATNLSNCDQAIVSVDAHRTYIYFAIAAFPIANAPRLLGVTFGVTYGNAIAFDNLGACGNFELAMSGWPSSGTGTAVTWTSPQTATLTPVYWFAGYNYYWPQPASLSLAPHPMQGGNFADDSVPAVLDPILDYGVLGFNQPGYLPCPGAVPTDGACCSILGSCTVTTGSDCAQQGGTFFGGGTDCSPNPCPTPTTGACCFGAALCVRETSAECSDQGGSYHGDGTDCSPNPCPTNPGACCLGGASCTVTSLELCTFNGGTFVGPNTDCTPNPCPDAPTGACCLGDGSCVIESEYRCLQLGGIYKDDGVACTPDPCSVLGACCFPGAHCLQLTENECAVQEGEYLGDGMPCETYTCGQPCLPEPIGSSSWPALPRPSTWPNGAGSRGDSPGPNAGGTLIVHTNPRVAYTYEDVDYCGQADLERCAYAVTREDRPVLTGLHVFAAFPASGSPRLKGVNFGIHYGTCVQLLNWHPCCEFESPDPGWPASDQGTGLSFNLPRTAHLTELYWFVAYVEPGRVEEFRLTPHPTQGAFFGDDSVPAVLDPIVDLGRFGWLQDGYLPCPDAPPAVGACCLSTECVMLSGAQCATQGGQYVGDGTLCTPNPCVPIAIERTSWGRVKGRYR
ncbi:MAG: hypothetical protein U0527_08665 [Candidatus Eisenbacteria bacterium]